MSMTNTADDHQTIVYKCVREFYEDINDITPFNYVIVVKKSKTHEGERPVFKILLMLNNKPCKIKQQYEIDHDLNTTEFGQQEHEYMQNMSQ